jgi:uridine kinase
MYRRIVRNMKAGRGTMEEIADFYLHSAKYSETKYFIPTKLQADIVLNGHNYEGTGKKMVVSFVKEQMK